MKNPDDVDECGSDGLRAGKVVGVFASRVEDV